MPLLLIALLALAPPAEDSSRDLARRIAASLAPRETVSLAVRNVSSLAAADVAVVRRELEGQLRSAAFTLAADAPVAIAVTLSENTQGLVWIAEIRRLEKREVVMVAPARPPERASKTQMSLEKQLVLEQPDPILDASALDGALLVLEPAEIVLHRRQGVRWERRQAASLPARVWPRDLRGRLQTSGDSFQAFLPGMVCQGKFEPELSVECQDGDAPWPSGAPLAKGRNYFDASPAPYYSVARLGDLTLTAGLDRRIRLFDANMQPAGSFTGWGSDIAGVETGCGSGRQALATLPAETGEIDAIQAFEMGGTQPAPVSPPLEFTGPVTALWPAGESAALAVSRDLKTGNYAAFRISAACNR